MKRDVMLAEALQEALQELFLIKGCLKEIDFLQPLTLDDVDALDCARLCAERFLDKVAQSDATDIIKEML